MYFVCKWWDTDRLGVLHSSSRPPCHCTIRGVLTWMRQMCVIMQIKVNTCVDVSRFWLTMFYSSLSKVQTNIFEDVYFKISENVQYECRTMNGRDYFACWLLTKKILFDYIFGLFLISSSHWKVSLTLSCGECIHLIYVAVILCYIIWR